jgi:hypothetical protein
MRNGGYGSIDELDWRIATHTTAAFERGVSGRHTGDACTPCGNRKIPMMDSCPGLVLQARALLYSKEFDSKLVIMTKYLSLPSFDQNLE